MQSRIADLAHVGMLAYAKLHWALFELMRGDSARAAPNAFELSRLACEHDLPMFRAVRRVSRGLGDGCKRRARQRARGNAPRCRAAARTKRTNFDGLFKIALAKAEARAGDLDRALAVLDEGLATAEGMGFRAFEAELHRARGQVLLQRDPPLPRLPRTLS